MTNIMENFHDDRERYQLQIDKKKTNIHEFNH